MNKHAWGALACGLCCATTDAQHLLKITANTQGTKRPSFCTLLRRPAPSTTPVLSRVPTPPNLANNCGLFLYPPPCPLYFSLRLSAPGGRFPVSVRSARLHAHTNTLCPSVLVSPRAVEQVLSSPPAPAPCALLYIPPPLHQRFPGVFSTSPSVSLAPCLSHSLYVPPLCALVPFLSRSSQGLYSACICCPRLCV